VVELVSPTIPSQEAPAGPVGLMGVIGSALLQVQQRHAGRGLTIQLEGLARQPVRGDRASLSSALTFLLQAVCVQAQKEVRIQLSELPQEVACVISRDGFLLGKEQAWLTEPFATTQQAGLGLALALVRRVLSSTGGVVSIANRDAQQQGSGCGGGITIRLQFPVMNT